MTKIVFWSDFEHEKSDFNHFKITLKHALNVGFVMNIESMIMIRI